MTDQTNEILEEPIDSDSDVSIMNLVESAGANGSGIAAQLTVNAVEKAKARLIELLASERGCVSTRMLRENLEEDEGLRDSARQLVSALKKQHQYQIGRSFYTREAFQVEQNALKAEEASIEAKTDDDLRSEGQTSPIKREYRREESRLCIYVEKALKELYATDFGPQEDVPYAFTVGNKHGGGKFENVDLITVDWRSDTRVELVTVEVKLDFTAEAVCQAVSYRRFSHRTWVAAKISVDSIEDAGTMLRQADPCLFDFLVSQGVGLLACRKKQGNAYEVLPIHWPSRSAPDPIELERFVERYREEFARGRVVPRGTAQSFPSVA